MRDLMEKVENIWIRMRTLPANRQGNLATPAAGFPETVQVLTIGAQFSGMLRRPFWTVREQLKVLPNPRAKAHMGVVCVAKVPLEGANEARRRPFAPR